jgi:hypothetical protein
MTPLRIKALVANPYEVPIFQAQLADGRWVRLSATRYERAERGWDQRAGVRL